MPSNTPKTRKGRVHNVRLEIRRDPLRGTGVRAVAFVTFPGSGVVQRIKSEGYWSSESCFQNIASGEATPEEIDRWVAFIESEETDRLIEELVCCGFTWNQMREAFDHVPEVEL